MKVIHKTTNRDKFKKKIPVKRGKIKNGCLKIKKIKHFFSFFYNIWLIIEINKLSYLMQS